VRRRTFLTGLGTVGALGLLGCRSSAGAPAAEEYVPDAAALQVYSSQHQNVTRAWADAFTAKTGMAVQIRQGQDASMGHQIVAEGDSSPADVFLTENSPAMTLVERAGLLAPIDAATRRQVPKQAVPSSGAWTGIAARSTVLVHNTAALPEQDLPASLMDLSRPEWKDRWACAAGGADFQSIVAGMLASQGEARTSSWLDGLKSNARILQNNIATMKAVNAGELPCGVIFHYYWYRDQAATKEGSGNTALHYFRNEDPGAFVSLSGGGVLASAAKPDEAQQFLAFVTGKEGQQVLVDSGSMEYAVGNRVESDPALPPLDSLEAPPVDPFALDSEKVIALMTDTGIL
jgi:iron(III) transport system substrate-binding protein